MKRSDAETAFYIPFLYLWGLQWMADAVLQYAWMWDPDHKIRTVLLWIAAAASAVLLLRGFRGGQAGAAGRPVRDAMWPLLAAGALVLAAVLLVRLGVVHQLFADTYRSFVLAGFYIVLGRFWGRELVWLGLWLLVISMVITAKYFGYAPIVLGFFGGASLIACGVIFRLWLWRSSAGRSRSPLKL